MTDQEKAIWNATYGASFAVHFWDRYNGGQKFDRAMENTTAEVAGTVADGAVRELRRWRREEDSLMGRIIKDVSVKDDF